LELHVSCSSDCFLLSECLRIASMLTTFIIITHICCNFRKKRRV
jgi:hypothetical protein